MAAPEYLICVECECPCYDYEWEEEELKEATCPTCGNDDVTQFLTEEDFETLIG